MAVTSTFLISGCKKHLKYLHSLYVFRIIAGIKNTGGGIKNCDTFSRVRTA